MSNYCVIETPTEWRLQCPASDWLCIPRDGRWTFDGDYERPTFSPSMNETRGKPGQSDEEFRCDPQPWRNHVFVCDGQIEYLSDCTHDLAGQTVPVPPLSDVEMSLYWGED